MICIEKYVGIYRVVCERDKETNKPLKNDMYIKCQKGVQIYRYSHDKLILYSPKKLKQAIIMDKLNGIEVLDYSDMDTETEIMFYEKDIEVVAELFKVIVKGKNIKPYHKRKY